MKHIIYKERLDEAIRLSRKYWKTGDKDLLPARLEAARCCTTDENKWSSIISVIDAAVGAYGLMSHATNQDIYNAFYVYGWEVTVDDTDDEADSEMSDM